MKNSKRDCVEDWIDYCTTRPEYSGHREDYRNEYAVELENEKQQLIDLLIECHLLLCEHQEINPIEWKKRRDDVIEAIDEAIGYEYE